MPTPIMARNCTFPRLGIVPRPRPGRRASTINKNSSPKKISIHSPSYQQGVLKGYFIHSPIPPTPFPKKQRKLETRNCRFGKGASLRNKGSVRQRTPPPLPLIFALEVVKVFHFLKQLFNVWEGQGTNSTAPHRRAKGPRHTRSGGYRRAGSPCAGKNGKRGN